MATGIGIYLGTDVNYNTGLEPLRLLVILFRVYVNFAFGINSQRIYLMGYQKEGIICVSNDVAAAMT